MSRAATLTAEPYQWYAAIRLLAGEVAELPLWRACDEMTGTCSVLCASVPSFILWC